jgi:hypothetical protein
MIRKQVALEDGFPIDKVIAASQALEDALKTFDNNQAVTDHWEQEIKLDPDFFMAANEYVCIYISLIHF